MAYVCVCVCACTGMFSLLLFFSIFHMLLCRIPLLWFILQYFSWVFISAFVCIEISIHQGTKREQNSLFATHPPSSNVFSELEHYVLAHVYLGCSWTFHDVFSGASSDCDCVCAKNSSEKSCFLSLQAISFTTIQSNTRPWLPSTYIFAKVEVSFLSVCGS